MFAFQNERLFTTGLQADGNDPVVRGENEEGAEKEGRRISVTKFIIREEEWNPGHWFKWTQERSSIVWGRKTQCMGHVK